MRRVFVVAVVWSTLERSILQREVRDSQFVILRGT